MCFEHHFSRPNQAQSRGEHVIKTIRFNALRLADAKLLTKTPSQIVNDGSDFGFFRQLQKELPA